MAPMSTALRLALVLALVMGLGTLTTLPTLSQSGNPIVIENQQSGTNQWSIPNNGYSLSDDTSNQIKGYASATSVNKGGALGISATVNPAQSFTIAFYRMGWYSGLGGRLLMTTGAIAGVHRAACPIVDTSTNLRVCNWTPSYTLTVPTTWTDGVYLAVLSNAQGFQTYVPFVVRDDNPQAALLYQQPIDTYEAYNSWGGKSLYDFNSSGGAHAFKVSFDRP